MTKKNFQGRFIQGPKMLLSAIQSRNVKQVKACLKENPFCEYALEKFEFYSPELKCNFYINHVPYIVVAASFGNLEIVNSLYVTLKDKYSKSSFLSYISSKFDKNPSSDPNFIKNIHGGFSLLHGAVLSGNLELVKQAVKKYKCNPNAKPSYLKISLRTENNFVYYYLTPIALAAMLGHISIIRYLLKAGAKHSIEYDHFTSWMEKLGAITPMTIAAASNNVKMLKQLIKMKIPVDELDHCNYTPLHQACLAGSIEAIELLMKHGANINYRCKGWSYYNEKSRSYRKFAKGFTPLHLAVYMGKIEAVKLLLEAGADLISAESDVSLPNRHIRESNLTPLLLAISFKKVEISILILKYMRKVNAIEEAELSDALALAIALNYDIRFIEFLMELGANPFARNAHNYYPIEEAVYKQNSSLLGLLFSKLSDKIKISNIPKFRWDATDEYGTLVNDPNRDYFHRHTDAYRLERACRVGDLYELKELLNTFDRKVYVDVNDPFAKGNTPLHLACAYGQFTAVQFLLSKNADCNAINESGESPLIAAIKSIKNNELIVRTLLSHGVHLGTPDSHNKTELMHAAQAGNEAIFELLLGADTELVYTKTIDQHGNNLFLLAVTSMREEKIAEIIEEGLDITVLNKNEDDALMLSSKNPDSSVSRLMIAQGISVDRKNKKNQTAFDVALESKHIEHCIFLIAARLLFAIANKQLDVDNVDTFDSLFALGGHANQHDSLNRSLLEVAALRENNMLCEYMFNKFADIADPDIDITEDKYQDYKYDLGDIARQASALLKIAHTHVRLPELKKLLELIDPNLIKRNTIEKTNSAEIIPITPQYRLEHQQSVAKQSPQNQSKIKVTQRRKTNL